MACRPSRAYKLHKRRTGQHVANDSRQMTHSRVVIVNQEDLGRHLGACTVEALQSCRPRRLRGRSPPETVTPASRASSKSWYSELALPSVQESPRQLHYSKAPVFSLQSWQSLSSPHRTCHAGLTCLRRQPHLDGLALLRTTTSDCALHSSSKPKPFQKGSLVQKLKSCLYQSNPASTPCRHPPLPKWVTPALENQACRSASSFLVRTLHGCLH